MKNAESGRSGSLGDWLTTAQAAELLAISPYSIRTLRDAIRRRPVGKNYRCGWLWLRADLERLIALRSQFGLRTATAARAMREGFRDA